MSDRLRLAAACAALYGLLCAAGAHATDVSTRPLKPDLLAKPNVIFGMDDSGSMDWEILLDTSSGVLQWNTKERTAWDESGKPLVPDAYSMGYLFPNGQGTGAMRYRDSTIYGKGAPPSPQFATLRSHQYNPLYYNPYVTYEPWPEAYHGGATHVYPNADPGAAKSHPALADSVTMDLTRDQTYSFYYQPGMLLPDSKYATGDTEGWASTTYYPATYWIVDPGCTPGTGWSADCWTAPDGRKLRRYEIKPNRTFPSGRSYSAEMQNFANWWSYYRKRKLMLAGSMGKVLESLSGMRLGLVRFNSLSTVTMHDADAPSPADNARRIMGRFYTNPAEGGTPTGRTLDHIGAQYRTNDDIIQYACQRNNAFIVTDGFANGEDPTPPSYDPADTDSTEFPYQDTEPGSIADVALAYYTVNLRNGRTWLTDGKVPTGDPDALNPDLNPDLHMNTYGLTLGVRGSVWPMPEGQTPWSHPFEWPEALPDTQASIDDLWHATINGRGHMYIATDVVETAARVQDGLNEMLNNPAAQSSVAVSAIDLALGDKIYLGIYNPKGWSGDVRARTIVDAATGDIAPEPAWSAAEHLEQQDWTTRVIATYANGAGARFTAAEVGSIVNPNAVYGNTGQVIAYLRGDRSGETSVPARFRVRHSLVGPVISARPAVSGGDGVVYAASAEGMLHAFDAATGEELWAYVPGSALPEMGAQVRRGWMFETFLDGSPMLYEVGDRKVLVGGRGAAGRGYYALDITSPRGLDEATLAGKVLWEFPSQQGVSTAGLAVGRPIIVRARTQGGIRDVALLTQGYNGENDGVGRLYMLDALTGELLRTFEADAGLAGVDPGLAQVSTLIEDDRTVRYVDAGDEAGNLWKFDLQGDVNAVRIATLEDGNGNRQPVTTPPAVVTLDGQPIVVVVTGRLLGLADFGATSVQSVYAIKDGPELMDPRTQLVKRTLDNPDDNGDSELLPDGAPTIDWSTSRGWYFDMPAGQQGNTEPTVVWGSIVFATNMIGLTDCSAASHMYAVDIKNGLGKSQYIGNYTVSSLLIVAGENGPLVLFQRSTSTDQKDEEDEEDEDKPWCPGGDTACNGDPGLPHSMASRKNSWRQIQRE